MGTVFGSPKPEKLLATDFQFNYDQILFLQSVPSKISAKSLTNTIEQQVAFDINLETCYISFTIKQRSFGG